MAFVPVTKGDPSKAKGTKLLALRAALRELAPGGWNDRGQIEQAMAEFSTLTVATCRDHLREWAKYGVLVMDPGYTKGRGHVRPPRVALTVLGRAWAIENGLLRGPVHEGLSENRRSEAPSARVSGKGAGQRPRPLISLQDGGASHTPPPGSAVVLGPEMVVSELENQTPNGHNAQEATCPDCDREPGHPGVHMVRDSSGAWADPPAPAAEPPAPEPALEPAAEPLELRCCMACIRTPDLRAVRCPWCAGPLVTLPRDVADRRLAEKRAERTAVQYQEHLARQRAATLVAAA